MTNAWQPEPIAPQPDPALDGPAPYGQGRGHAAPPPSPYGASAYGQTPSQFGQPAFGQSSYAQPAYAQPAYAQPIYGQQQHPVPSAAGGYPGQPFAGAAPSFASWGQRVGAFLIDALFAESLLIVAMAFAAATATPTGDAYGANSSDLTTAGTLVSLVGIAATIGLWVYNRVIRQGRTGQSIGKSALKIRLVSASTGQPVGPGTAFGRDLSHIVDIPLYLGYLWPLWDAQKQTFADKIVGSWVVRD